MFTCNGSAPNVRAMIGIAVEITVESRFCKNRAQTTTGAVMRKRRVAAGRLRSQMTESKTRGTHSGVNQAA